MTLQQLKAIKNKDAKLSITMRNWNREDITFQIEGFKVDLRRRNPIILFVRGSELLKLDRRGSVFNSVIWFDYWQSVNTIRSEELYRMTSDYKVVRLGKLKINVRS